MMNMLKLQLNDLSFNDRHFAVVFDEMARDASYLMISTRMEADVYSSATTKQILKCSHYK